MRHYLISILIVLITSLVSAQEVKDIHLSGTIYTEPGESLEILIPENVVS
jgi:hypothetical protein